MTLPKGIKKARSLRPAFVGQPRVDPAHIFGKQRLETPGPSLDDPVFPELCNQGLRVAIFQRAESQSNRFTLVSMIPTALEREATAV